MLAVWVNTFNLWFGGALCIFFFLTPGVNLAFYLTRQIRLTRRFANLDEADLLPASIIFSAAFAYLMFWVFFFVPRVGIFASYALAAFSLLTAKSAWRKLWVATPRSLGRLPLVIWFATYLFYAGLIVAPDPASTGSFSSTQVIHYGLPGDNLLPFKLADKMSRGEDPRILDGDWLASDRPPLQAAVFLYLYSVRSFISIPLLYQISSELMQTLWAVALYFLCLAFGFSPRLISQTLLFAVFSGFFFMNSVFVWPKFIAAALFVLGFRLWILKKDNWLRTVTGAAGMALGFLSHGGLFFSLLPLALCLPLFKKTRATAIATAGITFAVLIAPWMLYQKIYNPPGNRLIKWHLAGSAAVDERSSVQAIREAYAKIDVAKFFEYRWENIKCLFPPKPLWPVGFTRLYWDRWRSYDFTSIFQDLGVLALGFLIYPFAWLIIPGWRKNLRASTEGLFPATPLLIYWTAGILTWGTLIFLPGMTASFVGSYATEILIYAWLGFFLGQLPAPVVNILIVGRGIYFLMAYVLYSNEVIRVKGYPPLFGAGLAGMTILICALRTPERRAAQMPSRLSTTPTR